MKDLTSLSLAIEAILFAAGEPMNVTQLRRVLRRSGCDLSAVCAELDGQKLQDGDGDGDGDGVDLQDGPSSTEPLDSSIPARNVAHRDEMSKETHPERGADDSDFLDHQGASGDVADAAAAASLNDGAEPGDDLNPSAVTDALEPESFSLTAPKMRRPKTLSIAIREAIKLIERRWRSLDGMAGFTFLEVAEGYTFRTHALFGAVVAALKEEKPARLSRPAMESLAIVAYRQPVTKPEVDALRGVDCGGTLRVLLDRKLVAVVGKKEEPGRPLLYGTTEVFLSLFNLANLAALPSLREFNELNQDSEDTLRAFDGLPSLAELSSSQKQFRMDEGPSIDALDTAVERLKHTEEATRTMLMEHGVTLATADGGTIEVKEMPPPDTTAKAPEAILH